MAYQALYRRYRPTRFEDFVGQEAIVRTLASQVMSGRIAHAYLFCGTRGTGKTSAAKVFARAINCEHPQQGDPCGACATCRALAEERNLDILEIDAASNNGVDEIRDLREKVKYPPQSGRFKVYIIDEVHMLSTGAFNALLKTLEEPPAHAKFILATTEPQKIPATILSRCQRFDFGRIPSDKIAARLGEAMAENGVTAEHSALLRIARAAEGGMRDAWSITDMCLGYALESGEGLTDALVRQVLGASDGAFLFRFVDAMLDGDAAGVLGIIDEAMRGGQEAQVLLRDVTAHVRRLIVCQVCGAAAGKTLELSPEETKGLLRQAGKTSRERLMAMLETLQRAEADLRWAAQPRYGLETAALRCCLPEEKLQLSALAARVAELERRPAVAPMSAEATTAASQTADRASEEPRRAAFAEKAAPAAPRPEASRRPAPPEARPAPVPPKEETAKPEPEANAVPQAVDAAEMGRIWKAGLQLLRRSPMVYALAMQGHPVVFREGTLIAAFNKATGATLVSMLNEEKKRQEVAACLSEAAGYTVGFRAALEGENGEDDAERAEAKKRAEANLKRVFDFFGRDKVEVVD